jgi:hypothetical protein
MKNPFRAPVVNGWHTFWHKTLSPEEVDYWNQPEDTPVNWRFNAKSFVFHVVCPIVTWFLLALAGLSAIGFALFWAIQK